MKNGQLSAGGLLGNMMGAVDFGAYFGDDSEGASVRWIFFICLVVFVVAFSFNLVVIHEKPLKKPKKDAAKNPLVESIPHTPTNTRTCSDTHWTHRHRCGCLAAAESIPVSQCAAENDVPHLPD